MSIFLVLDVGDETNLNLENLVCVTMNDHHAIIGSFFEIGGQEAYNFLFFDVDEMRHNMRGTHFYNTAHNVP